MNLSPAQIADIDTRFVHGEPIAMSWIHHDIPIEFLREPLSKRIAYIRANKPDHEIDARLRALREVPLSELPAAPVDALRAYEEAMRAREGAMLAHEEAWRAREEAWLAYDEARRVSEEAWRAYWEAQRGGGGGWNAREEAGRAYAEAHRAHEAASRAYETARRAYDEARRPYRDHNTLAIVQRLFPHIPCDADGLIFDEVDDDE